ncbi:MAG: GNAT family N-acetyltransferase [bacterium]
MTQFNGTIRSVTASDYQTVKSILTAWLTSDEVQHYMKYIQSSVEQTPESKEYDSHYLVAETLEHEVIGILGYRKPIPKMTPFARTKYPAELNMLYVSPEKRGGQGIGTALTIHLEKELQQKKYTEIVIRSAKRFEQVGWGFYDKYPGFQRVGVLTDLGSEDAQIWSKVLTEITQ